MPEKTSLQNINNGEVCIETIYYFGSQYGTAKSYAQKLSQLTDIECISYDKIKNRLDVESVIYIGGLYAGGVKGLKTTMKYLPESADLTVVTVGLADVNDPVNVEKILHSLRSQLAHDRYIKTKFFTCEVE